MLQQNSKIYVQKMNQNFMDNENFISNKENLNGFEDTMDEPMDIDPSTPFALKIRQTSIQRENNTENNENLNNDILNNETQLKEQRQQLNGPKIVKPIVSGPKIIKPIDRPKIIKPNGLPLPHINTPENYKDDNENDEFGDIDPFKTKSNIGLDITEFQTPVGFNLNLSEETINCTMDEQNIDPFKTKSSMMNSPVRNEPPKTNPFKSPPAPPIINANEEILNGHIDEICSNSSIQTGETNSLTDEWETHQKRSNNRSANNSLNKQKSPSKQLQSEISSNTDISSTSDNNLMTSPTNNKNVNNSQNFGGLSISPSESASESTSVLSSNTASTSSITNRNADLCEAEFNENLSTSKDVVWAKPQTIELNSEEQYTTPAAETPYFFKTREDDFKTPTYQNKNEEIIDNNDEEIEEQKIMEHLKNNKFIGNSRNEEETPKPSDGFENNLVDFSEDTPNKIPNIEMNENINTENINTENINTDNKFQANVENVVFDSIFSSDTDFNSFLDLLEKKEVDNSIKRSPKYSEFARKSLYLQFDPITQLNLANSHSLSPEKVKRLSLINDKKNAIKSYLCDIAESEIPIAEEKNESENNDSRQNQATDVITITDQEKIEEESSNRNILQSEKEPKEELININEEKSNIDEPEVKIIQSKPVIFEEEIVTQNIEEKILPKTDMIIPNNKDNDDISIDNFQKIKLDLPDSDSENRLIDEQEIIKKDLGDNKLRLSVEKTHNTLIDIEKNDFMKTSNDTINNSFKLITENSMMFDESQLLPNIKTVETKLVTNKDISTEDLSSSSVCTTSASAQEIAKLLKELNDLKEREKTHLNRIDSLETENDKFKTVLEDFEDIFNNLVNEKDEGEVKLKNEIIELTKERDHLQEDVVGVERAFDDLHRRFEKLKTKVEEFKKNEESLTNAIDTYKQQLDKEKFKYSTLKKHAEEKIDFANSEIEKVRKQSGVEIGRLTAELRKAEIKISSLDLSVQQKDQENSQLTSLLEDLLQKVKPTD